MPEDNRSEESFDNEIVSPLPSSGAEESEPISEVAKEISPDDEIQVQPKCHIHDKVESWKADEIRKNVCFNDEIPIEFEGKHYCLFHLPTKEKDIDGKFEEKFRERLKAIEDKIAAAEKLPEAEQEKAKSESIYDFRYVWFPSHTNFSLATFSADAHFNSATFSTVANFSSATFSASVDFSSATFSANAYFNSATFSAGANFRSATFSRSTVADFSLAIFSAEANFRSATFSANADFNSATFSPLAVAYFSSATFSADANFRSAKFLETSKMFFLIQNFVL